MSDYPLNVDGYLAMSEQLQKIVEAYRRIALDVDWSPLTTNMTIISGLVKTSLDLDLSSRLADAIRPVLESFEASRLELADLCASRVVSLSDETLEALKSLETYVPEEKQEEFQEIIQPGPAKKGNRMTFDRVLSLVMLLLTLLTLLTTFLPDKEAQLSNANEAAMLENQRETNELLAEQNRLLKNISDALQAVRDDCDAVPELAGAIDDLLQDASDGVDAALECPDPEAQSNDTEPEEPADDEQ